VQAIKAHLPYQEAFRFEAGGVMAGAHVGDGPGVLQVHPTQACNLRCRHCYSSSGPEEHAGLSVAALRDTIADAAAEGYVALSVSGGEPLLYPGLTDLLVEARQRGLAISVTTNGTLLDARRLDFLRGRVDLLSISLDGVPESHDRMRASEGAFAAMEGRLEGVREAGLPFGFLFTLTRTNAHELGWLADFAAGQGARHLQIQPLAETGRAAAALHGDAPDDFETAFAWVAAMRLRESLRGRLRIHLDLLDRAALRAGLSAFPEGGPRGRLADLVTTLVVEADGTVAPLRHGFPRAFALGSLQEGRLRFLGERWRRGERSRAFADLCRRTIEELRAPAPAAMPFVNWHEEVARRAAAA
jgi:MoaA/NifB/PqqE/SkfB family radical SAM enzyme